MGSLASVVGANVLAGWLVAQVGGEPSFDAKVQRGVELRLAGNEAEALAAFEEAARTEKTPRLLAQMALAEQSLGHWRDAEGHLLEALASADDAWIVKQRAALEAALDTIRRHLGSLELAGGSGAYVFVDGRPEGKLPRTGPLRLEVGRHRVEVRGEGSFPFARDVEIASDTIAREAVVLSPVPRGPDPSRPDREGAGALSVAPAPPPTSAQRAIGWSLLGGGAASSVLGVAALLASNERARDYNADPACAGRAGEPEGCAAASDAARSWRVASVVSLAAGGALVAAGVVVLVWRPSGAPVRVQLAPGNGVMQLSLSRLF